MDICVEKLNSQPLFFYPPSGISSCVRTVDTVVSNSIIKAQQYNCAYHSGKTILGQVISAP